MRPGRVCDQWLIVILYSFGTGLLHRLIPEMRCISISHGRTKLCPGQVSKSHVAGWIRRSLYDWYSVFVNKANTGVRDIPYNGSTASGR